MAESTNTMTAVPPTEETLVRRAKIARLVALGKRTGYGALLVAIGAFVVAAISGFPSWTVTVATVGLVIACVALPGAIVFGYGIKAAEREERGGGSFH
jgi:ABC-type proline/glycine betaine transport system permease subunit